MAMGAYVLSRCSHETTITSIAMPDVTVRNDTSSTLNIAFCFTRMPVASQNGVEPGQTFRPHLASFVHALEVRLDNGSNRFSHGDGWQKFGEIAGACAAGTVAVGLGAGAVLGAFSGHVRAAIGGIAGAGFAWEAAHARTFAGVILQRTH